MGNSSQTQGLYPASSGVVMDLESASQRFAQKSVRNSVSPLVSKRNSGTFLPFSQQNFKQQLETCEKTGEMFKDSDFPASDAAISSNLAKFLPFLQGKSLVWRRSKEIFGTSFEVFKENVEPGDIRQGFLGNCYFLGALAAVAEFPKRVFELFEAESRKPSDFGCYCVRFCVDGEWSPVILDDFFPTFQENVHEPYGNSKETDGNPKEISANSLIFSRANGPELWVMLLEKAYAKIYGSYEKIEKGLCEHALRELTGAPTQKLSGVSARSPEEVFGFLAKSQENGYISVASSDFDTRKVQTGLVSAHCYTVLSTRKLEVPAESLIQLRNPWGHKEWTGDWSDSSKKWTEELRKSLALQEKNDGVFWMNSRDFCAYFDEIVVCKVNENCRYFSKKFAFPQGKDFSVFAVKVAKRAENAGKPALHLAISQKDARKSQGKLKEYAYFRAMFCEFSEKKVRLLCETSGATRDLQLEVSETLHEAGVYVLFLEKDLTNAKELNETSAKLKENAANLLETWVLSAYSSYKIEFSELSVERRAFFESLFANYERNCLETEKLTQFYGENLEIRRVFLRISDFLAFGYFNATSAVSLNETLVFEETGNLFTLENEDFPRNIAVSLASGAISWVFLKTRLEFRDSFAKLRVSSKSSLLWTGKAAELEAEALKFARKTFQRKIKEQIIQVFVSVYCRFGVLCFVYVNESGKNYVEVASFLTKNLKPVGFEEKSLKIELKNSEKRLFFFEIEDQSKEIYYKLTYVPIIY